MKPLQSYHYAWLAQHPLRTESWQRQMLIEGFQVHHMDGDHSNDAPDNLVLIEAADHMMLHGMNRLKFVPNGMRKKQPKKIGISEQQRRERFAAYMEGNKCLKRTEKAPSSLSCLEPSAA